MKKAKIALFALAFCLALSACSSKKGQGEQINIIGSSSVEPLITGLSDQFSLKNPAVEFLIQAPGSSAGIRAAIDETADIGMTSRALTEDELKEDIEVIPLALDGIVLIVNPENPITDLSMDELHKIFAGEILSWKEVGGPDRPIVLVSREAGSGTRDAFDKLIDLMEGKRSMLYVKGAIFCDSTNSVSQNVADKGNAIGYVSLGSLNDDVKPIAVDGVHCTEENIKNESYVLSRPFDLLVNKQAWNSEQSSKEAHDFVDYLASEEAANYIIEKGFIPVR